MLADLKRCSACGDHKPFEEFHLNKTTKDGRMGVCKSCRRAQGIQLRKMPKPLRPKRLPLTERFWLKVNRSSADGCWEWDGALNPGGYGKSSVSGKTIPAHRVAWELTYGPIPDGLMVCHQCDNPRCVRPDHLFLGTATDNTHDALKKGRWTTGEKHPGAKLTESSVREIREKFSTGLITKEQLSREYGVSGVMIGKIVRYERWRNW